MFEKIIEAGRVGTHGETRSTQGRGGGALRALEWSEITARLEAARDLRAVLRSDSRCNIGTPAASFGDAAERCFGAIEDYQRPVNPDALEACKALECMVAAIPTDPAARDARND